MPAFVQELTTDLSQTSEANNPKPLHPLARSPVGVLPPFVDRKAKGTNRRPLLAETNFRRITQKPKQNYFVHTLAHGFVLLSLKADPHRFTERCRSAGVSHPKDRIFRRLRDRIAAQIGEIDQADRRNIILSDPLEHRAKAI